MPFCMAFIIITISLSEIVTLQVRIPKQSVVPRFSKSRYRKAFLSASVRASMTLEAAMVLSLLIFASVSLILPMKVLNTERKIQAGLEAVGEKFSQYAYLEDVLGKGDSSLANGADGFEKKFCQYLKAGAAEAFAQNQALEHADTGAIRQATMLRSRIMEDGAYFDLILDYKIQMPFPVLGLGELPRTARCRRRAWIGAEGKDGNGKGDGGTQDEEIVYVGKGSTRYHKDRNCHYLVNNLSAVSYEQALELRNKSGGKYYACAVCGKQAGVGDTVYISPEGSSYHTTQFCTSMLAYVRAVPLSEVEHLGACSYCSK